MHAKDAITYHVVSLAQATRLLRRDLREAFPGVRFRVRARTHNGGAITVTWIDGPTRLAVAAIADRYAATRRGRWHNVKTARPPQIVPRPDGTIIKLNYGANVVLYNRIDSERKLEQYRAEIARFIGGDYDENEKVPVSVVRDSATGLARLAYDSAGTLAASLLRQIAYDRPWLNERCPGGPGIYCPHCGAYQPPADHLH